MKYAYSHSNISDKVLLRIEQANLILDEYMEQGYKLTLRQLYYQLVARDLLPNKVQEYKKLSSTMVDARMGGLTDWDAIEDRLRVPQVPYYVEDVAHALSDTEAQYRLDRQIGQLHRLEIWTEKDAVSNILKRVTHYYQIRLMVNRGYSSCSAMRNAALRLAHDGRPVVILYVGDHDPSGLDMVRDIQERLEAFELEAFVVNHIALTREQIIEFNPPPNPAKITDPRAGAYISEHGSSSWELDALKPEQLYNIVGEAVEELLDTPQFYRMIEREKADKSTLSDFRQKL